MLDPQGFSDVADRDMEAAALVAALNRLLDALHVSGFDRKRAMEISQSVGDALDAHNATPFEALLIFATGAHGVLKERLKNHGISVPKQ